MSHKKRRKPVLSGEDGALRPDPLTRTDPLDGTAPIAPVTAEMMDHAAHEAAERTDAVAHDVETGLPVAEADPVFAPEHEETDHRASDLVATESSAAIHEAAERTDADAPEVETVPPVPAADPVLASEHEATGRRATDLVAAELPAAVPNPRAADTGDVAGRFAAKSFEIAVANVSAMGDLVTALLGAKSLPEAAAINADHARRHLDVMATGARDLVRLSQSLVLGNGKPRKDTSRER